MTSVATVVQWPLPQPSTKTASESGDGIMARVNCSSGLDGGKFSRPLQAHKKGADPRTDSLQE